MIDIKNNITIRSSLTPVSFNLYEKDLVMLAEMQEAVKEYDDRYISRTAIVRCAIRELYNNINAPGDLDKIKNKPGD